MLVSNDIAVMARNFSCFPYVTISNVSLSPSSASIFTDGSSTTFDAKPQSRATVGSRAAGLTLDGGESGGNRDLSADAVAFCLRVLLHLASCG